MFNGIKIMKSDMLPNKTMIVSSDLYDLLTKTNEELTEDRKKAEELMANDWFNAQSLFKRVGGNDE